MRCWSAASFTQGYLKILDEEWEPQNLVRGVLLELEKPAEVPTVLEGWNDKANRGYQITSCEYEHAVCIH